MPVLQTDKGPNRENSDTERQQGGTVFMKERGTPQLSHLLSRSCFLDTHIHGSGWFWLSPNSKATCFPRLQIYHHCFYYNNFGADSHRWEINTRTAAAIIKTKPATTDRKTKGKAKKTPKTSTCSQKGKLKEPAYHMLHVPNQEEWILVNTSLSLAYWQDSHKGQWHQTN